MTQIPIQRRPRSRVRTTQRPDTVIFVASYHLQHSVWRVRSVGESSVTPLMKTRTWEGNLFWFTVITGGHLGDGTVHDILRCQHPNCVDAVYKLKR